MLGARIAALRRSQGINQATLAQKLNISPSAVGMYEQGRREPSAELLVEIAKVLDVSVDYLLTGHPATLHQQHRAEATLLHSLAEMDKRFALRGRPPFSREEMAVLFAALLMES